jgi:drug/metabolite transporter (DMT)-like permease
MNRSSTSLGLLIAVIAAATFGLSGALAKPVIESGWSPAAAVTVRVLVGGLVLAPLAILSLRGRWSVLWRARRRVLLMAVVGVGATQFLYFAAIERIPVGTAVLIEYLAPLLLVALVWARTRRTPTTVVLIGSVVALGGLVLVVSPGGSLTFDILGYLLALGAMVGIATFYLLAARPSDGLPGVALAGFSLLLGGLLLGVVGLSGLLPFAATTADVPMFGAEWPWWLPLLLIGIVATAIAYSTSIAATAILGSRVASFVGLLEVVAATFYAWLLLGEQLTVPQLLGGLLILVGIAFVRSERTDAPLEPLPNRASATGRGPSAGTTAQR